MALSSTSFAPGASGNPSGRPKGSRNRASAAREQALNDDGLTPLDFMLAVLCDENASFEERKWAAERAAPYVHPRMATVSDAPFSQHKTHEEWLRELADGPVY